MAIVHWSYFHAAAEAQLGGLPRESDKVLFAQVEFTM
jgi:hypothetical protein